MGDSPLVRHQEIMGGVPCFAGTRVPFRNLIDYIVAGHGMGEFLADFPAVTREVAVAALRFAADLAIAEARTQTQAPA